MTFSLRTLFAAVTLVAVVLGGMFLSRNEGPLVKTGKPLDLAIVGEGYFQIRLENCARTFYTRRGNFHLDCNAMVVTGTAADRRLLYPHVSFPQGAIPIFLPQGAIHYYWAGDPEMMITMGTLQLATFQNPGGLRQVGDDLYEATDESGAPIVSEPGIQGTGMLRSGYLEHSLADHWYAGFQPFHALLAGMALVGGALVYREQTAQRRELAKMRALLADFLTSAPAPSKTC
jgi:flagellar basal body rod protein FlgG